MNATLANEYRLAVVVLNYQTPQLTINCLQSLLPQIARLASCVNVVDNNSTDDSIARIDGWISEQSTSVRISLTASKCNGGFAAGNNLGMQCCKADYYLFLNSDTVLRDGAIERLLSVAAENPMVGLVSPRLEFEDGRAQPSGFKFHSPISEFCRAAQTAALDKLCAHYQVTLPLQSDVSAPEWTSFACVLIKQQVFAAIGSMDAAYFMYFEDCEFCLRAARAGWKIAHDPAARVVHLRGGSSSLKQDITAKRRLPRYYYQSRTRYFYQSLGWLGLTAANLAWSLGRVISLLRQLTGRVDKRVIDCEWRDIWINWSQPLTKFTPPRPPEC